MNLTRTLSWSGALRRQLQATPDLADWLAEHSKHELTPATIQDWFNALQPTGSVTNPDQLKYQLRLLRRYVFFTLMERDMQAKASLRMCQSGTEHGPWCAA